MTKPKLFLTHDQAEEAYNRGEAVKVSSTSLIFSKQPIKMKDSACEVSRMGRIKHMRYELVSKDEYEFL